MASEEEKRLIPLLLVVLLVIAAAGTLDLYLDQPEQWLSFHVLYEVLLIVAALVGATVLWRRWREAERSVRTLERSLGEREAERDRWRESARAALEGLGRVINEQFQTWGLTPAEREVALLLLKGHSHKTIARLTGRSERTVRQHSVTVYEKAGVSGRAELAAFFLEDLILPSQQGAERPD